MNIKKGSMLIYTTDAKVIVEVIADKKVLFEGKEYSLSAVTKKIKQLPYYVAPCRYWLYKGKNLQDIYEETYPLK